MSIILLFVKEDMTADQLEFLKAKSSEGGIGNVAIVTHGVIDKFHRLRNVDFDDLIAAGLNGVKFAARAEDENLTAYKSRIDGALNALRAPTKDFVWLEEGDFQSFSKQAEWTDV